MTGNVRVIIKHGPQLVRINGVAYLLTLEKLK